MDTRYWGPSGWQLLHLIAAKGASKSFWMTIPFILPCKFCRASLTDYYKELPLSKNQAVWLYKIHNKVNDKLRKQGHPTKPDPSQVKVLEHYKSMLNEGCTKTYFPGWELLFSIADNHPYCAPSKPMPDAPISAPKTLEEKNRYNMLTPDERITQLKAFWTLLPDALPFKEWQTSWKKYQGPIKQAITNRRTAKAWLWKIKCGLESDLEQLGDTSYNGLCKQVAKHRSGCSTSKKARTCRKMLSKTRRHSR